MALGHLYFLLKPYIFKVECPESVSFSSKRPAEERRKLAERLKKNIWSTNIWKPPTGQCGRYDVLFVRSILDHTFANVYWRNNQSYFRDNWNYFFCFSENNPKKVIRNLFQNLAQFILSHSVRFYSSFYKNPPFYFSSFCTIKYLVF